MRRAAIAVLLASAALQGCGSLDASRYEAGPGKPTARMRVEYAARTNDRAQIQVLRKPLSEACGIGIADIAILTTLGGSASSTYEPALTRDVVLAAGEPINLSIFTDRYGIATVTTCGFRVRFQPEANADYHMVFTTLPGRCRLELNQRLVGANGAARMIPVPFVDPHPECNKPR